MFQCRIKTSLDILEEYEDDTGNQHLFNTECFLVSHKSLDSLVVLLQSEL